jgi:glycosyltransferase involved in cell wall biosynthesis
VENKPLVSVVIPTYNHANFIAKAIESVRVQTYSNWEAIIVNNYSEDATEEIVASFNDSRIRLVNFRNNGIIAASRNHGIKLSNGEYVAFLDSDDIWYTEKLERCLKALRGQGDIVCHGEVWVREGAEPQNVNYGPAAKAQYHSLLLERNCLSTSAIVAKKSCLEAVGYFSEDPAFVMVEDYDLWLRISRAGYKFIFLDDALGQYTIHTANNSRSVLRQMRSEIAVLRNHFNEKKDWPPLDRLRQLRRMARVYIAYGRRWVSI